MEEVVAVGNKSYEIRRDELMVILGNSEILSASDLQREWSNYVELVLIHCDWQAIWKLSRLTCELFNISYPTLVYVNVDDVCYADLTASVTILATFDNVRVSRNHEVPLSHLWPTKGQKVLNATDIYYIADCLDLLRFFYINILMPWDIIESNSIDWIENRLNLFYDIKLGKVPCAFVKEINGLISEGNYVHEKMSLFFEESSNDEELMSLQIRTIEIKNKFAILDKQMLRNRIVEKEVHKVNYYVVVDRQRSLEYQCDVFKLLHSEINDNDMVQTRYSLESALDGIKESDTLFLSPSTHNVDTNNALENIGTLIGLKAGNNETIIKTTNKDILFNLFGDYVLLKNLTIQLGETEVCAVIRRGLTKFVNCKIVGNGMVTEQTGILALQGSVLEMYDCTLSNLSHGINACSGSDILLEGCTINNVQNALKVYDDSKVVFRRCSLTDYSQCAIYYETEKSEMINRVGVEGGIALLQFVQEINMDDGTTVSDPDKCLSIIEKHDGYN